MVSVVNNYNYVSEMLNADTVSMNPVLLELTNVLGGILEYQLGMRDDPLSPQDKQVYGHMAQHYLSIPGNNSGDVTSRMVRYVRDFCDTEPVLRLERQHARTEPNLFGKRRRHSRQRKSRSRSSKKRMSTKK